MDLQQIRNDQVRQAIEALQNHDKQAWYACFTTDAKFTDDGRSMDFVSFFDNAFNHKEKFLTMDRVSDGGLEIIGEFYAGQWGTFRVYFRFHQNQSGKFHQLDIGQASKR
jgi:hypothetical protein